MIKIISTFPKYKLCHQMANNFNTELQLYPIFIIIYWSSHWPIILVSKVFTNALGDRGSIPGRVIPTIENMVLDAALLNT